MTQKLPGKVQPRKQPLGVSQGVCCLPYLGAHCDGMEDFFPAPQAQAASVDAESGHKWAQGAELLKTLKYFYSYKKLLFSCFTNT